MPRGKAASIRPGDQFGLLIVVAEHSRTSAGKRRYLCRCSCGQEHVTLGASLTTGRARSCGCLRRATTALTGEANRVHGHKSGGTSRNYATWANMIQRCTNPKHKSYASYGARGITVCVEWLASFEAFLSDMGDRPAGRTLDRIDNDGPYCKANCRWSTVAEQAENRRPPRADSYPRVKRQED